MIKISVVIITWNAKHFLEKCLTSIYKTNKDFDFELIVIDNNSTDGSIEYIKNNFPDAKLILNTSNKGVGPARNQGLKIAKGKFVLILDVDTELITENSFEKIYHFMEQHKDVGITGAKMFFPNGDLQHTCRRFPSVHVKLLNRFENIEKIKSSKVLRDHYMLDIDHTKIQEVDYIIGAFQFIRKDVIDKIGLYDEKIFYGPEDIDFCLRARKAGYKVYYFPDVCLYHFYQRITKKLLSKITFEHIKGLIIYFVKHKYFIYPKV